MPSKEIRGKCLYCQTITPIKPSIQAEVWSVKPDHKLYPGWIEEAQTTGFLEIVCAVCDLAASQAHAGYYVPDLKITPELLPAAYPEMIRSVKRAYFSGQYLEDLGMTRAIEDLLVSSEVWQNEYPRRNLEIDPR